MFLGQKIFRFSGSAVACYASAGAGGSSTMVRPPMVFYCKYANSLYSAASKTQKVDKVEQDSLNVTSLCGKDPKFKTCDLTNNMVAEATNRLKYLPEVALTNNDEINRRIWTIPNGLCLFRILVSPLVAYTIINNQPVASLVICVIAGLSDFADGYIARRYESQRSTLGSIIDPVADKIIITTLFISTAINGQLPVLLASIVIGRDLILILGGFIKRYQILPQPRTLKQFFNLKGLNMEIKSSTISKWNTTFQFTLIGLTIVSPILNMSDSLILIYFQYLVATTTIASGVDYIFNRDNYISSLKRK